MAQFGTDFHKYLLGILRNMTKYRKLLFCLNGRCSLEISWTVVISNKSTFLKSDVPQDETIYGMDNLNNVIFTVDVLSVF